jgi:hypothetical protein
MKNDEEFREQQLEYQRERDERKRERSAAAATPLRDVSNTVPNLKINDVNGNPFEQIVTEADVARVNAKLDQVLEHHLEDGDSFYISEGTLGEDGFPQGNEHLGALIQGHRNNVILNKQTGEAFRTHELIGRSRKIHTTLLLQLNVANGIQSVNGEQGMIEHAMAHYPFRIRLNQGRYHKTTDPEGMKDHFCAVVVLKGFRDYIEQGVVAFNSTLQRPRIKELKKTFEDYPDLDLFVAPSEKKQAKKERSRVQTMERRGARNQGDKQARRAETNELLARLNIGEFTVTIFAYEIDRILNLCL